LLLGIDGWRYNLLSRLLQAELRQLMEQFDTDSDGQIDYADFCRFMSTSSPRIDVDDPLSAVSEPVDQEMLLLARKVRERTRQTAYMRFVQ
jgi:hypothetical protein